MSNGGQIGEKTRFAVGRGFEDNVLLDAFNQGVTRRGDSGSHSSHTSDQFEEEIPVGLDQLLMIRAGPATGSGTGQIGEVAEGSESRINVPFHNGRHDISLRTCADLFAHMRASSLVMPLWNCWNHASRLV